MTFTWKSVIRAINRWRGDGSDGITSKDPVTAAASAYVQQDWVQFFDKMYEIVLQSLKQIQSVNPGINKQQAQIPVQEMVERMLDMFMEREAEFNTPQGGRQTGYSNPEELNIVKNEAVQAIRQRFPAVYEEVTRNVGLTDQINQNGQTPQQPGQQDEMVPFEVYDIDGYDGQGNLRTSNHRTENVPARILELIEEIVATQFASTIQGYEDPNTGKYIPDYFMSTLVTPDYFDTEGRFREISDNPEYMKIYNQIMLQYRENYKKSNDPAMREEYQKLLANEAMLQKQIAGDKGLKQEEFKYNSQDLAQKYQQSFLSSPEEIDKHLKAFKYYADIGTIIDALPEVFQDIEEASKSEQFKAQDGRIKFILDSLKKYKPGRVFDASNLANVDPTKIEQYNSDLKSVHDFVQSNNILPSGQSQQGSQQPGSVQFHTQDDAQAGSIQKQIYTNKKSMDGISELIAGLIQNRSPLIEEYVIDRLHSILAGKRFGEGKESSLTFVGDDGKEVSIKEDNTITQRLYGDLRRAMEKDRSITPEQARVILGQRQRAVKKWGNYSTSFARMTRDFADHLSQQVASGKSDDDAIAGFDEQAYNQELKARGIYDDLVRAKDLSKQLKANPNNPQVAQELEQLKARLAANSGFEAVRKKHLAGKAKTVILLEAISDYVINTLSDLLTVDNLRKMQQTSAKQLAEIEKSGFKIKRQDGMVVGVDLDSPYVDFGRLMGLRGAVKVIEDYYTKRKALSNDPSVDPSKKPRSLFPGQEDMARRILEDTDVSTKDPAHSLFTSQQYMLKYIGDKLVDPKENPAQKKYDYWQLRSFLSIFGIDSGNLRYGILQADHVPDKDRLGAARECFSMIDKQARSERGQGELVPGQKNMLDQLVKEKKIDPGIVSQLKTPGIKGPIFMEYFDNLVKSGRAHDAIEIAKNILGTSIAARGGKSGGMGWEYWRDYINAHPHSQLELPERKSFDEMADRLVILAEIKDKMEKFGSVDNINRAIEDTIGDIIEWQNNFQPE